MTTFRDSHIDWLADLLATAAAQEVMPRFRRIGREALRIKSSAADLVTDADESAEQMIAAQLAARYPNALIVGEEGCSASPGLVAGLSDADLAFAIDPVDGTFNFACGVPLFGVMLAVVIAGETVAGIIHDPIGKDSMVAVRGGGARIRRDDGVLTDVRVANPAPVSEMIGSVSWQFMPMPERAVVARNHAKCLSHIGYRCAAHEYRLIASGGAHFAVYNKLMPWDHLAGALIHEEAGGYSARFDGTRYRPSHVDGGLLLAPSQDSWNELRRELWTDR